MAKEGDSKRRVDSRANELQGTPRQEICDLVKEYSPLQRGLVILHQQDLNMWRTTDMWRPTYLSFFLSCLSLLWLFCTYSSIVLSLRMLMGGWREKTCLLSIGLYILRRLTAVPIQIIISWPSSLIPWLDDTFGVSKMDLSVFCKWERHEYLWRTG